MSFLRTGLCLLGVALFDRYVCGFNQGRYLVSDFKLHFTKGSSRDDGGDGSNCCINDYFRKHLLRSDLADGAGNFVSNALAHLTIVGLEDENATGKGKVSAYQRVDPEPILEFAFQRSFRPVALPCRSSTKAGHSRVVAG
jgi:hypothetical protein